MIDSDGNSLYFLTAKGKSFYERLKKKYLSLTGMKGKDTMSCTAVSVRGKVRELGAQKVMELFEKNPYMYEIYPDKSSRSAICVFQIKKPIERANFSFGKAEEIIEGYFVTDKCINCKLCYSKCPQKCIDISCKPVIIHQSNCLHCGNCFEICPVRASKRKG